MPDRLPLPQTVDRRSIVWINAMTIAVVHLLALAACLPSLFSWSGVLLFVVGVHVFGQAINICYHRQLAHRSFKTSQRLEYGFVVLALCCLQDTPARWVATHRLHHRKSDERPDPHSPLAGFFWAHLGWLLAHNAQTRHFSLYDKYARDLLADPFYMRLEKQPLIVFYVYIVHALAYFVFGFAAGALLWDGPVAGLQFGLSALVWGVFLRTVVVWHFTWSVNSLAHLFGYRNYETNEHSRNNWLVALVTLGEGWHNNHHHDQASASNQHRWWELDVSYYEIKLLERLGLATQVVPPTHKRRRPASERPV